MISFIRESSCGDDMCIMQFIDLAAFLKYVQQKGTVIVEAPDEPDGPYHLKTVD